MKKLSVLLLAGISCAPFWLREEGRIACGRNDFSRGSGNTGKRPRGNRKRNGNARSQ